MNTSKSQPKLLNISLVLLAAEPGKLVGDHDIQLRSTLNNLLAFAGGHVVGNLSAVSPALQKIGCKRAYGRSKYISLLKAHLRSNGHRV